MLLYWVLKRKRPPHRSGSGIHLDEVELAAPGNNGDWIGHYD
jgi:hypothetical protein